MTLDALMRTMELEARDRSPRRTGVKAPMEPEARDRSPRRTGADSPRGSRPISPSVQVIPTHVRRRVIEAWARSLVKTLTADRVDVGLFAEPGSTVIERTTRERPAILLEPAHGGRVPGQIKDCDGELVTDHAVRVAVVSALVEPLGSGVFVVMRYAADGMWWADSNHHRWGVKSATLVRLIANTVDVKKPIGVIATLITASDAGFVAGDAAISVRFRSKTARVPPLGGWHVTQWCPPCVGGSRDIQTVLEWALV